MLLVKVLIDYIVGKSIELAARLGLKFVSSKIAAWAPFAPYELIDSTVSWEIQQQGERQTTVLEKEGTLRWRTNENLIHWEFVGGDLSTPIECSFQPGEIVAIKRAMDQNVIVVLLDRIWNRGEDDMQYAFTAVFRDTKFLVDAQDFLATRVRYPTQHLSFLVTLPPEAQMTPEWMRDKMRMLVDYGGSIEVVPPTSIHFSQTATGKSRVSKEFDRPRTGSIVRLEWPNPRSV